MIARRQALVGLSLGALSVAHPALAQQPAKPWRVGFFYIGSRQSAVATGRYGAFLESMRELGYVEGRNLVIEERFALEEEYDRLPLIAMGLSRSNVDVIVVNGTRAAQALKQATTTVPIVVAVTVDPVGEGLAASLGRPGRNFTGLSAFLDDVFPKHIELLKVAIPKLSRVATLFNPGNPGHPRLLKGIQATAQDKGIQVMRVDAGSLGGLEQAFGAMSRDRAEALIILGDSFFVQHFWRISALAVQHRLASTYSGREYPYAGGFLSYGPNFADNFHRAAIYVDKILKGAKPGELPFEQPTKLYLIINRKTATALGLTIPQELLLRADFVIE
jgi:putative ABC transport system substrate-binding protein